MIKSVGYAVRKVLRQFGVDLVRYSDPRIIAPPIGTPGERTNMTKLREACPYPQLNESVQALLLADFSEGREIIEQLLYEHDVKVMLEIGSFFGASAIRWARAKPDATIVCIDPWTDGWTADVAAERGYPEFRTQLSAADGFYHTVVRNLREYGEQVIMARGFSPDILPRLLTLGLEPQLIYIDATKTIGDLIACHRLWPKAILTGDDWLWKPEQDYPMQQVLYEFAGRYGFKIKQQSDTWQLIP